MKLCAKFSLFLSILFLVALAAPSFAVDPAVRQAGLSNQATTFCDVLKVTQCDLVTTSAITPSDSTATSTFASYYLPDTVEYPIELEIQNLGASCLQYVEYATVGTAGITLPTASSCQLLATTGALASNGLSAKRVYYTAPTEVFRSASGTQSAIFIVRGRKGTE